MATGRKSSFSKRDWNKILNDIYRSGKTDSIIMKIKISLLLCWLGIHRYKIINSTFGFGQGGAVNRVQCKICGIKKIKQG